MNGTGVAKKSQTIFRDGTGGFPPESAEMEKLSHII
jgi:hypothetical protein